MDSKVSTETPVRFTASYSYLDVTFQLVQIFLLATFDRFLLRVDGDNAADKPQRFALGTALVFKRNVAEQPI